MNDRNVLIELERYARQRIAAERHPHDAHFFKAFGCDQCGVAPFAVTIEYHTGSKKGNFKGVIMGHCATCGVEKRLFSFTGPHREPMGEEKPVCQCGHDAFLVAECERIERDEGLLGFFDEGVVVGQCARCGRNRAFVYTD